MGDLTTSILIEIRDEMKATRTELSGRLDQTNERLERVEKRQVASEMRLATELVALNGVMREVVDKLSQDNQSRERIGKLEVRVDRIEREVGGRGP